MSQKASIEDLSSADCCRGPHAGTARHARRPRRLLTHAERRPFQWSEAIAASWEAKWELFLPIFVVGAFVGGVATLVESAPLAALYTLIVQRYIHRDLPTWKDVLRVASDCVALVGGVLLILAVAAGLTDYLVYAEIPTRLVAWTQSHIHSRLVFLLGLNVFLLLVGTLMDIFSAIVVVVPLILPIAEIYGVNYVHLGIIFVANLNWDSCIRRSVEPVAGVGAFQEARARSDWATLPMLGILASACCLITYVPWLTGLLHWMGRVGLRYETGFSPRSLSSVATESAQLSLRGVSEFLIRLNIPRKYFNTRTGSVDPGISASSSPEFHLREVRDQLAPGDTSSIKSRMWIWPSDS